MKSKLISLCKSSKIIYKIYFYVMFLFLNFLKLFIKVEKELILINSFGGKKFDDSPKAIYENLIVDSRFQNCRFVWAFHKPQNFEIPRGEKIKTDTLKYYVTALKAGIWISNSGIERGLSFKNKKTFYYNSWHGTPIKLLGRDLKKDTKSFKSSGKSTVNLYSAQSNYEVEVMSKAFGRSKEDYVITGLPRNDELFENRNNKEITKKLREKLGIDSSKKVILFAPTFREYNKNKLGECITDWGIDFKALKNELGEGYVILLRAHYEAVKTVESYIDNEFVYNFSDYPELNELILASDILISDYSSIMFDYSILNRPMICFAYDYIEYSKNRGLYFDIRKELRDASEGQAELVAAIKELETESGYNKNIEFIIDFRKKYVDQFGNAAQQVANLIFEKIRN